jgi:hypothetical protein
MAREMGEKTKAILAVIAEGKITSPKEIAEKINAENPKYKVTAGLVSNLKSKAKKDAAPATTAAAAPKATNNGSQPQAKVAKFSDHLRAFKEAVAAVGGPEEAKELLELLRM